MEIVRATLKDAAEHTDAVCDLPAAGRDLVRVGCDAPGRR